MSLSALRGGVTDWRRVDEWFATAAYDGQRRERVSDLRDGLDGEVTREDGKTSGRSG